MVYRAKLGARHWPSLSRYHASRVVEDPTERHTMPDAKIQVELSEDNEWLIRVRLIDADPFDIDIQAITGLPTNPQGFWSYINVMEWTSGDPNDGTGTADLDAAQVGELVTWKVYHVSQGAALASIRVQA